MSRVRSIRPTLARAALAAALALGCAATRPASPIQTAILLSDKGRTREAVELLERHLRLEPRAVRERALVIRLYGALGDLGAAERHASALSGVLGARSPAPLIELGHALELAHRYDEALARYDEAAAVAPSDAAGPRVGGLRAAAWGEVGLAEPRLLEATRRDPADARTWHALGLVRAKGGDLSGAEQAYRSGLARDPGGVENRIGLATLALLRDDPRAVLAEYDALLAAHPKFADAHLGRSWALVRLGRYGEATQAIDRAEALGASARSVGRQRSWLSLERAKSAGNR